MSPTTTMNGASAKSEGLGLGHIDMPGNDASTSTMSLTPASPTAAECDRYQVFKPSRNTSRHQASVSSPPSMTSFAAQFKTASSPGLATTGGPPSAAVSSANHSDLSTISYPTIVSRTDMSQSSDPSSYGPPPAPPTQSRNTPSPPQRDEFAVSDPNSTPTRKGSKSRPPPIKLGKESTHSSFLGPLLERPFLTRFGSGGKDKEGEKKEGEKNATANRERSVSASAKGATTGHKADAAALGEQEHTSLVESQNFSVIAQNEETDTVSITLARAKELQDTYDARVRKDSGYGSMSGPSTMPTHLVSSKPDSAPAVAEPTSPRSARRPAPPRTPQQHHRRATSEGSPKIVQQAAFSRPSLGDNDLRHSNRPATSYSSSDAVRAAAPNASPRATEPNRAPMPSPSALERSAGSLDDAFFPVASGLPRLSSPVSSRRPSAVPRPLNAANSVGISVRSSATLAREVARAGFNGSEGATVLLQSQHRPDEMEVAWSCTSGFDSAGQPWTQWAVTLKPKNSAPAVPLPPLPSASSSAAASKRSGPSFSTYRLTPPEGHDSSPAPSIREDMSLPPDQTSPRSTPVASVPAGLASSPPLPQMPPSSQPFASFGSHRRPSTAPQPSKHRRQTSSEAAPGGAAPTPTRSRHRRQGSNGSGESSNSSGSIVASTAAIARPTATKISTATRVLYIPAPNMGPAAGDDDALAIFGYHEPKTPTKASVMRAAQTAVMPPAPTQPNFQVVTIPPTPQMDQDSDVFSGPASSHSSPLDVHREEGEVEASADAAVSLESEQNGIYDDDGASSEGVDDVESARRDAELALKRGQHRMASKWSDTEGEDDATSDDDDDDDEDKIAARRKTSWSGVSDGLEEDLIVVSGRQLQG